MSTQIINFKKVEVVAKSKEAAIEQVESTLFHVNGDATQAYKNWKAEQTQGITERDVKAFMLDYLAKKSKNCPGAGYLITVDPAVADTRERPYKIEDIKNEQGKRKYKKTYQLIDTKSGLVLGEVQTNKADAKNLAKKIIKEGFEGKMVCKLAHKVIEGQEDVFTAEYAPSKNSKNGTWIAFGIEA